MHLRDLGVLDGPLILFGGIHSNAHALGALLDLAARERISPDRMLCTGDVVAYCGQPREAVERLMALDLPVLKGNCEAQLARGAEDCGCGFEEGSTCSVLSVSWYRHAAACLDAAHRDWMDALPDLIVFRHAGRRCALVHGGASAINAFIWPDAPQELLEREIALLENQVGRVDLVISGHSGLPFLRRSGRHEWLNAGALGLPGNDGTPRTRYATLDADGRAEIRFLDYDHEAAARAMEAAGLTQGYHRTLRDGVWPSQDILPPGLRHAVSAPADGFPARST